MNTRTKSILKILSKSVICIFLIWLILFLGYIFLVTLNSEPNQGPHYSLEEKKLFKELVTELKIEDVERYDEPSDGTDYVLSVYLFNCEDYKGNCFDTIAEHIVKKTNRLLKLGNNYKYYQINFTCSGGMYDTLRPKRQYRYNIDSISKVNRNYKEK